jgi:hypothetical protein
MKKVLRSIILLFLLIIISCQEKENIQIQTEVEQTILDKVHQSLNHWAKGDPVGYSTNFANDATYIDDIGASIRLDSLKEIRNYLTSLEGKIPPHNYELVDPKVQVYDDIAILTFHYHGTTMEGEPVPSWKATSVYRLSDGEWHVVHANWSLVKEQ